MSTNAMGNSRGPNSRSVKPAHVNAGRNLNAHDLIVGLAGKDPETVERFRALDLSSQVIVAKAALAWMRRIPEGSVEDRDIKLRTLLAVHRRIRGIENRPGSLISLRIHLAPIILELRRRQSAIHALRVANQAWWRQAKLVTDEVQYVEDSTTALHASA